MNDLHIVTLGCRLNAAESETMRAHATKAGLAATVIVNGCAVTGEAMRQTRQAVRRAKRDHPAARIVVAGCAAQIDAPGFAAMPEVDAVIGNDEKMRAQTFDALAHRLSASEPIVAVGDIMAQRAPIGHLATGFDADTRNGHARAFVEVQQGCDHRCTFCIIPFGRGNNRSAPAGEIVAQIRALVGSGVREIVLTGVDITGWGGDLPGAPTLGQLARRILKLVPALGRLRFSSIDVAEIDDDLLRLIADEERLLPHLHLSLQAGSDMILKRMKRRHSRAQAIAFCHQVRALRPDMTFGADLIAGFPTESDSMFADSLDLVAACDLAFLHVFPFSARNGTPAARMPQLPKSLRKERAAQLREAGARQRTRYFDTLIGRSITALVENRRLDRARGHSDGFAPIDIACEGAAIGRGALVTARVEVHDGTRLNARLIDIKDRHETDRHETAAPDRNAAQRLVSAR
ncbi:MAG: tRNA (N(6)-L-threonylcarbamoyladenosine(37)-C(2))-methylthiotransferase MtaB [Dongiaceae bacterium]